MSAILNLRCGTKTSPMVTNIDRSIHARLRRTPVGRRLAPLVLKGERRRLFLGMDDVLVHDLKRASRLLKGASTPSTTRMCSSTSTAVPCRGSWLRSGGFLGRAACTASWCQTSSGTRASTIDSLERACGNPQARPQHDTTVSQMILQMVRREAAGTSKWSQAPGLGTAGSMAGSFGDRIDDYTARLSGGGLGAQCI
jgi:hypothetical protein